MALDVPEACWDEAALLELGRAPLAATIFLDGRIGRRSNKINFLANCSIFLEAFWALASPLRAMI